jgi:hypothetical protein
MGRSRPSKLPPANRSIGLKAAISLVWEAHAGVRGKFADAVVTGEDRRGPIAAIL